MVLRVESAWLTAHRAGQAKSGIHAIMQYILIRFITLNAAIHFHSHRYVIKPLGWLKTNITCFDWRSQCMIDNCVFVTISSKLLLRSNILVISFSISFFPTVIDKNAPPESAITALALKLFTRTKKKLCAHSNAFGTLDIIEDVIPPTLSQ